MPKPLARLDRTHGGLIRKRRPALVLVCAAVVVTYALAAVVTGHEAQSAAVGGGLGFVHGSDAAGIAGAGAFVWISNGDGTFTTCRTGTTGFDRDGAGTEVFGGSSASQTFVVDANGDGLADIVHASENSGQSIWTYPAQGDGTFATTAISTAGIDNTGVGSPFAGGDQAGQQGFLVDVTGDGVADYVFTRDASNIGVFVWPGNGDGTFSTAAPIATTAFAGTVPGSILTGQDADEHTFLTDVTADGNPDLVHVGEGGGRTIAVWAGIGDGTFETAPVTSSGFVNTGVGTGVFAGTAASERSFMDDLTGDDVPDFVYANETGIFVWPGTGAGAFSTAAPTATTGFAEPFASFTGQSAAEAAQLVDVTGDDVPDYVMSKDDEAANAGIYVWRGLGDGTFATAAVASRASGGLMAFATGSSATETSRIAPVVDAELPAGACTPAAPGGVGAGLAVWNRADAGIGAGNGQTVQRWQNSADSTWSVAQATAGARPTYHQTTPANLLNFNPSLRFDGGDELFKTNVRLHHGSAGFHGIVVGRDQRTTLTQLRAPMGLGTNGNFPGFDLQTDASSPSGWNPFMGSGSSPNPWPGSTASLFNGNGGRTNRQPQIFGLASANGGAGTASNNLVSSVDGFEEATTLDAVNQAAIGGGLWIGSSGDAEWLGLVSEAIVYSRRLSAPEVRRVNSYLALKYGITLGAGGGPAQDYHDSAGATIRSEPAYHDDVAGIGRDDASALDQRQSASVNAGGLVTMGLGGIAATNAGNPTAFDADRSFLVWGHNGAAASLSQPVGGTSLTRMARVWRVTETGPVGDVRLRVPTSALPGSLQGVVRSADPVFDSSDDLIPLALGPSGYETTLDFANGDYFTLAAALPSPGGVEGESLWLRGDIGMSCVANGCTVTRWDDVSGNSKHANVSAGTLSRTSAGINFNPVLGFDNNEQATGPSLLGGGTYSDANIYVVSKKKTIGPTADFYEATTASRLGIWQPWTDGVWYWDAGNTVAPHRLSAPASELTLDAFELKTYNASTTAGQTLGGSIRQGMIKNGRLVASDTDYASFTGASGSYFVGGNGINTGAEEFAELIVYLSPISAVQQQAIQSYLALKYGITLDQTAPQDYVASDGSVIWDATADATYSNRIAGIGRDDASALVQRQSRSSNPGANAGLVTIGRGTIAADNDSNPNQFEGNRNFLLWGDRGGSVSFGTAIVPPPDVLASQRMERVWRVQETGEVGQVTVGIPSSVGNNNTVYLVVSDDETFDAADTFVPLSRTAATAPGYLAAEVDLESGTHFTFATTSASPGGVEANLQLWLRADAGVTADSTVSSWADQSPSARVASQGAAASQPGLEPNAINFNPALDFDGTTDWLNLSSLTGFPTGNSDRTVAGVAASTNPGGAAGTIVSYGTGATNQASILGQYTAGPAWFGGWGNDLFVTGSPWSATPRILLGTQNNAANTATLFSNGASIGTHTSTAWNTVLAQGRVGRQISTVTQYWPGPIGEIVLYNRLLTANERLRVNSYLALKYGLTLDQTTATSYLDSGGDAVWNGTTNASYANNVAGIGLDIASGLVQKQSRSVHETNNGNFLTVGLGTIAADNETNPSAFAADRSFLVWGDDGGRTIFGTPIAAPPEAAATFRMNRVWRVQETGTVGSVKVAVPASIDQGRTIYLVVSDDATFDGADEFVPLEPHSAGEDYLAADVELASGQHLTFATYQIAPGGVAGSTLWLRADRSVATEDTTVVGWRDVANGALFAQDGAQALPLYETSNPAFNFNPSVDFVSGTATRLRGNVGSLAQPSPDRWSIFASVVKEGNNQRFFAHRNDGSNHYHLDSSQGGRAQLQVEYRTGATVPNAPLLVGVTWDETTRRGYLDGRMTISPAGTATTTTFTFPGEAAVGGGYGLADWTGHVAEIVAYDRDLTIAEARRVNSYLALKYGRTLDQTPATSYVASDNSIVWDATANGGFAVDIAGIGRDDLSGLDQKQSASANAGNIVTVGLDGIAPDNESNGSTFAEDKSFLVWGHDGASTEVSTAIPGAATLRRMNRVWKVDETKSVPEVLVRIPAGQLPAAALSAEPPALVVSSDAAITSGDTFVPLTLTNDNYEATVDLADGDHFTFAATVTAPGGVAPGLQLWLRADKDLTVNAAGNATGWADQSQQGRNADAVFSDPLRRNAAVNFNPTVNFDGNDWFRFSKSPFVTGLAAGEMFGLTQDQAAVGCACGHFFDFGSGSRSSHYVWSNEYVYDGFGTTDRLGWHPVTKAIADAKTGVSAISGAVPAIDVRAPHIYNVGSATSSWHVAFDGQTAAATGTNTASFTLAAGNEHIGAVSGHPYRGDVAEVTLYDRRLTGNERARVNTYYALKYGVTLPALDYLDSASTVLWPTGNGYGNDIAGIGRDDASGLDQRQSASINAGNVVTVGHGTIAADNTSNPNGFDSDRSFALWGHNGATAEQTVAVSGTSPALFRMARIWRVEETGQVGTVLLRIPTSALRGRANATLIRSTDTTFTSADALVPLVLNGSAFEATVDLADGEFFTFASLVPGPGGVTAGLHMWWRADGFSPTNAAGAVTDIDDETGNYALGWTSHGPQKIAGGLNFNPYVNFKGSDWIVRNDSQSSTFTQGEKFAVGRHAQAFTGNNGVLFRFGESTAHAGGSHYLHSNGYYYNDFCSSERKAWNPSTRAVVEGGGTTTGPAVDARRWHILGMRSATNNWVHQFDAVTAYTDTASAVNCAGTLMYIGAHESYPYNGDIAEGFVYNRVLSIDERLRANTYLALKYGITLGSTATPVEYRASNSTPIWVADAAYQNDVAGIGRDDRSALDQRQSTSVNPSSVVTIGHGTIAANNQANPNPFPGDGAYLVWGDNGQPTTASTPVPDAPTPLNRMARIWKVQETGSIDDVVVRIPVGALAGVNPVLIRSADPTFGNDDPRTPMVQSGLTYQTTIDLTSGEYFTFAAEPVGPGGVTSDLQLWLRADEGLDVDASDNATLWIDRSVRGRSANLVFSDPQRIEDAANFNPVVRFDGDDSFRFTASPFVTGYTAGEVFATTKNNAASTFNNAHPYDFGSGNRHAHYTWGNGAIYDGFGTTDRLGWNPTDRSVPDAKPGLSAITGPTFDTHDYHLYNPRSATDNWGVRVDGTPTATSSTNTTSFALDAGNEAIGRTGSWTQSFVGDVGDVILYNRTLTPIEVARVNSYLAVKYGITLDQTSGGQNYVSSRDVTVWDKDFDPDGAGPLAASAFNQDIAGIQRDVGSALTQPKSRSINPDAIVTMSVADTPDDGDALLWGNDGGGAAAWGTTGAGSVPTHYRRIARTWSVQSTGDVGPVSVAVDVADPQLDLPAAVFDYFLLRDADGDGELADETPLRLYDDGTHGDETAGDNQFTVDGIVFAQGEEFTVATFMGYSISGRLLDAPGGAGLNGKKISLLLDGGAKVTVTTATDAAGGGLPGEFLFTLVDMRTTRIVAVFVDDEVENGMTVTRDADDAISGLDIIVDTLVVRHEDAGPVTNDDLFSGGGFDGAPDADVTAVYTVTEASAGTLSTAAGVDLRVRAGASYAPGGDIDLDRDLAIEPGATLTAGAAIALAGDWINEGTFTAGASTVTLDGGDQAIVGPTTFNHLVKREAADDGASSTLTIDAGGIGITGTLTLDGLDADDLLRIRSGNPGVAATIAFTGPAAAHAVGSFLDVEDSALANDAGAAVEFPVAPASSYDSGNTTNWFGDLLVEFTDTAASDAEASGGNLPTLTVSGHGTSDAKSIHVALAGGTAAQGADFTFLAPVEATIPAGDYTTPQVVPFAAPAVDDDGMLEEDETIVLELAEPASGAAPGDADGTDGVELAHTYTIEDDEAAAIEFELPSSTTTDELVGPPVNARLRLTATTGVPEIGPGVTVQADVAYDGASTAATGEDIEFDSVTVAFGEGSGDGTLAAVPYTLLDDPEIEGDENAVFRLFETGGGTVPASIGPIDAHTLTITDDDVPGVSIVQTDGSTTVTERGASDVLQVRLTARPTANVTVSFTADLGEAAVGGPLVFTPADWDVFQTLPVTAVDDPLIEGSHIDRIDLSTVSADPNFDGLARNDVVTVSVTDDDQAGAVVVVYDDVTSEDGDTGTFGIRLTARPSAPVTIALSSSNEGEATVPASITIQPDNWDDPSANIVTVAGVDDDPPVGDGAVPVTIVTGNVTSVDANFEALDGSEIDDVTVHNQNNDPPGIAVEAVDALSGESGATAAVRFRLLSRPALDASVTIPLSVSDSTEAGAPASITIAADDWNNPAANEVLVTGLDDFLDDGDLVYRLVTGDPTSADPGYDALGADDVADPSLTNVDDDEPAVLVFEPGGATVVAEGNAPDTIEVQLATEPAPGRQVVLQALPHPQLDLGSGPGQPVQLVFTSADWNEPHIVLVSAVDDARLEGDHSAPISYLVDAGLTTEEGYDPATVPPTTVSIGDNDTATASVAPVLDALENPAENGQLRLTLSNQNDTGGPIEIAYTVAGTAVAGADYTALTGTVTVPNGQTEATIAVETAGHDDALLEGPETVIVTLTASDHAAITVDPGANEATVTIHDDETATATLSVEADGDETGPAHLVYRVELSSPNETGAPITFAIDPSGGRATADADYVNFAGATVSVPAGSSVGTHVVTVLDDDLLEGSETAQATISAPSLAAVTIAGATATASIADDETALASVAPLQDGAENPAREGLFQLSLSSRNDTGGPIAITYAVAGTAGAGSDYATLSGTAVIPDGQSAATIAVVTAGFDDALLEGGESVIVTVTGTDRPTVTVDPAANEATVVIADDEIAFAALSVESDGAEAGPVGVVYRVDLSAPNDTGAPITFAIDPSGGTAAAGTDFGDFAGATVTIPTGESSATFAVGVLDDDLLEGTESVEATISTPSFDGVTISAASATASIADDEAAIVALTASDPAAAENPADPGELAVELSRPNDTGSPLEVRYTVGGTGTADADYDVLTGIVVIPDGQTAGTIPVDTTNLDDALLEGSETVVVTLTEVGHGGVTLDPDASEATVTIADDETATAALSVESDGAEAGPVEIVYTVTLSRANSTGAPITFAIDPSGGTAAAGADYANFAGTTVTVPVGSSTATHVVAILDDGLLEGTESVEATISSPSFDAVTISAASATASIADDESATVGASASDATAGENPPDAGELTIALSRRNDTGSSIEVAYSVAGTATAGSDYAPLPGSVSILDGETAVTVPVDTTGFDDARPEGSETVRLTLSTVGHPAVAIDPAASEATVTITDDDVPGVDVVETDGSSTVAEGGAGDELRVRLTAQPAADVVVSFTVDVGQVGSWETLQFTPGDWDVWQLLPLWAIDDPAIEGLHEDRVDFATSSDDPLFDGLAGDDVAVVSVVDDDVAGAVVVVLDDVTSEDGETGSFGIRLTARPSAPVTIALSSSDPTEVSAPASITIQPDDWDDPSANVVTVTGVDDDPPVGDGAVPVTIVTGNVTSDDLDFDALDGSEIDDVVVHNQNNDPPGIAVEVVDGASGEDASAAVVRFRLLSQPAGGASVTVPVSVSDSTEGSLAAASVTIANGDWNDPAANELSITGVDDFLDDGDVPYQLVTGDPTSADPGYDDLAAADAVDPGLVNVDDDEAAFELVESDGSTQVLEGGATDTISLVLGTQPAPGRQVVMRVIPHPELDLGAGPGQPVLLVFTDADWDEPHVLTVAAGEDGRLEGDHSAHVSFLIDQAATTEDGYDTLTVDPITVSIGDDEAATASIAFVRNGVENPAQTALMRVALTQQNDTGGPIEIHYTFTGTATPDADHTLLSGTIAIPNGQTQATLTIDTNGHDDALLEGPETVTATLTTSNHPAVTIDPTADEATVTIVDDETATATLSVAADGDEAGPTSVVYSVTLSRVNDTGSSIALAIDPSGGTSTTGNDYVDFGGATVTIPAGASSATSEVDVLDDDLLEGAQTVQATISEPSLAAVTITDSTATASIADDETATATLACDTTALTENPGSIAECTVTLSLPNGTGAPLTVSYSVGGSASSGTDYAALSGTITIADGDSSGSLLIDTTGLDDDTAEGNETVVPALTGSSNPNVTVGSPNQVVLTIADDDHVVTSFRLSASGLLILGSGGDSVACRLAGASLRACTVTVRTAGGRIVARGKISSATGKNPLVVRARRTSFGKRLLARNLGGIRVVATANGVATTGDRVTARAVTRAILNPERFVTPSGTWIPGRAALTTRGHRFLARLRGNIRSVRSMTCAGHTARVSGESERAIALSRARARVMCQKLRGLGARGPANLVVKGYSKPIATNATEAGRRQNRRVVVALRH